MPLLVRCRERLCSGQSELYHLNVLSGGRGGGGLKKCRPRRGDNGPPLRRPATHSLTTPEAYLGTYGGHCVGCWSRRPSCGPVAASRGHGGDRRSGKWRRTESNAISVDQHELEELVEAKMQTFALKDAVQPLAV